MSTYLQLGRYGDILIILPLLYDDFKKTGEKSKLIVSRQYCDILEGCSYVDPVIYEGDWTDIPGAIEFSKSFNTKDSKTQVTQIVGNSKTIITQVYGTNHHPKIGTDSFAREMWNLAGRLSDWKNNLPLVFDRRDTEREKRLLTIPKRRKTILVASSGISSPFQYKDLLHELIWMRFSRSHNIIDISDLKAERLYDLLGLYEQAHCLVATDSAPLHLAYASNIPVIALTTDTPTLWHGSPYRPNHIAHVRYSQFPKYALDILDKIADCRKHPFETTKEQEIIHIWNHSDMNAEAKDRNFFAKSTWPIDWVDAEIPEGAFSRNSLTVLKDKRPLPFLKDIIRLGALKAKDNDILVLTNSDSCLHPNITNLIKDAVNKTGSCFSHRWDFNSLETPLEEQQIAKGVYYPGSDLHAFSKAWWNENMLDLPDLISGYEAFDKILRNLILKTNGTELKYAVYHKKHTNSWEHNGQRLSNPSNLHNRKLAKDWLTKNNLPLQELANLPSS